MSVQCVCRTVEHWNPRVSLKAITFVPAEKMCLLYYVNILVYIRNNALSYQFDRIGGHDVFQQETRTSRQGCLYKAYCYQGSGEEKPADDSREACLEPPVKSMVRLEWSRWLASS